MATPLPPTSIRKVLLLVSKRADKIAGPLRAVGVESEAIIASKWEIVPKVLAREDAIRAAGVDLIISDCCGTHASMAMMLRGLLGVPAVFRMRGNMWDEYEDRRSDRDSLLKRKFVDALVLYTNHNLPRMDAIMPVARHMADAVLPRVAWKTGTSSGHRDAWTVAYNPEYVVGVWLGNPDGSPSDALVGGSAAGPVAGDIFRRLYPAGDSPWFAMPDGIETRAVCACSGLPPSQECSTLLADMHIPRISPTQPCAIHRDGGEHWPAELQAFMERNGVGDAVAAREDNPLGIETPVDGETYRLLPASPGIRQEIKIAASGSGDTLYWFVDNEFLRTASAGDPVYWPLEKGTHSIACADAAGRTARVSIVVE